jgi:hypothetical protein
MSEISYDPNFDIHPVFLDEKLRQFAFPEETYAKMNLIRVAEIYQGHDLHPVDVKKLFDTKQRYIRPETDVQNPPEHPYTETN